MIKEFFNFDLKSILKNRDFLDRRETLQPYMEGRSYQVHNGKKLEWLEVVRLRVGIKAGQFIRTRKFPRHKKKVRYHY